MRKLACGAAALMLILGATLAIADDDEVEIDVADLPKAVVDAVQAKFPDGKIVEAEQETEDGKTVYEVEVEEGDKEYEVEVSAEGEILEVEEEDDEDDDDDD